MLDIYIYISIYNYIYTRMVYVYIYIYTHMSIPRLYGLTLGPKVLGCSPLFEETVPFAVCLSAPLNRDVIINSCYIFDICILHILSYSIHLPKDCWCSENKNWIVVDAEDFLGR